MACAPVPDLKTTEAPETERVVVPPGASVVVETPPGETCASTRSFSQRLSTLTLKALAVWCAESARSAAAWRISMRVSWTMAADCGWGQTGIERTGGSGRYCTCTLQAIGSDGETRMQSWNEAPR